MAAALAVRRMGAPGWLFLLGAAILALHPLLWLIGTWQEPAYNSQGLWVALAVLGLAAWSFLSETLPGSEVSQRYALALLAASAAVRLVGQVLRINVVGALTLAIDVYALATLLGLHRRRRPLSPGWLALLFAFSLPLERVVQRLLGYGLQSLSADGACSLLGLVADSVRCFGNRILLGGQDVLVDLPCSGSRGLLTILMLFTALAAITRPSPLRALLGLGIALTAALLANMLRIALLAMGLAQGLPLMDAPWHEALGVFGLMVGAAPVLWWARRVPPARTLRPTPTLLDAAPLGSDARHGRRRRGLAALGFVALAAAVVSLPAHPVDVSRRLDAPALPGFIGGHHAQRQALSELERQYFTRYGGGAARAMYGPYGLTLVSTAAPLRHLHAPDECLSGAGHRVRYLGLAQGALPTALYRSIDPEGRAWRVSVSYVSERGETAASVGHAVWQWLQHGGTWTMVQRIAPWDASPDDYRQWERALLRALDLPDADPDRLHLTPNPRLIRRKHA